ncbi:hypothetical protein [Caulobacter sp. RL271]|jgi:hypothetical protein|uniref:Uncharacterized protein n=1 Tax=Caulobacter segnis TaxID=88688 RepID=A0ABY4ZXP0_9CAUL|nr:hypothetical protein [Caulobacter segnis]USQ97318.1 hypothetical protein MZV50_07190 [Caulobacter segnis]
MPTYLFYPRRADGVSLTFIAEAAADDLDALELAAEIAAAHACSGVFVWEPAAAPEGKDRFVGEVDRLDGKVAPEPAPRPGAAATV